MKLLELLVQELPKRGGWPEGAICATQSVVDGEIYFYDRPYDGQGCMPQTKRKFMFSKAEDNGTGYDGLYPIITREQYEAALQQSVWDGKGLPPVGCECEVMHNATWQKCKILVYTQFGAIDCAVYQTDEKVSCSSEGHFRPIRSERDEAIAEMRKVVTNYNKTDVIHAIEELYDAGYRKLSD